MKKIRKKIAEIIIELGMIVMPKFKHKTYLHDFIDWVNIKHGKVQCNNGDGSEIKDDSI